MDASSVVAVREVETLEERLKRVLMAEEMEDLERTEGDRTLVGVVL